MVNPALGQDLAAPHCTLGRHEARSSLGWFGADAARAGPEYYSDANAIIAVMLATSVFRLLQDCGW
jgi:hypothetical protein